MEFERFEDLLLSGTDSLSVATDRDQVHRLYRYFQELRRWSRKVNLISKNADAEQIVINHFIDSAALLKIIDGQPGALLDIGSGAGFPGLVCKAMRTELPVWLVEPRLKRVSFLRHIIRLLDLKGIEVHAGRLEDGTDIPGESDVAWVVGRAVAEVGDFLQMCARFRRYRTAVVCMKGPRFRDEFDEQREAAGGWHLHTMVSYSLPRSGAQRTLLVFQGREPLRSDEAMVLEGTRQ